MYFLDRKRKIREDNGRKRGIARLSFRFLVRYKDTIVSCDLITRYLISISGNCISLFQPSKTIKEGSTNKERNKFYLHIN